MVKAALTNANSRNVAACSDRSIAGCLGHCLELCVGLKNTEHQPLKFEELPLKFVEQSVGARRPIFRSGDQLDGIPIICSGWAAVYANLGENHRQIISFLLPHDLVSFALIFDGKLEVTVEAITDVTHRTYDRAEFRRRLTALPTLLETVVKSWADENLQLSHLAVSLGQHSAEQQIIQLILDLSKRLSARHMVENNTFYFPLRQTQIAEYTGITPVHVNTILGQLRRDRLINLEHRMLTIQDEATLRRICER